jgi:glycosyltransferase involved in cell wall biosynthesis
MKKKDYSDTTVIIPTLNEGSNISELLNLIEKQYKNISIIV